MKKSIKKLSLNKVTISSLDQSKLNNLKGGAGGESAECEGTADCEIRIKSGPTRCNGSCFNC